MTDQFSNVSQSGTNEAVISEALGVIDAALAKMMQRELVSSGEVADLLLDVRTLLTDVDLFNPAAVSAAQPASDLV